MKIDLFYFFTGVSMTMGGICFFLLQIDLMLIARVNDILLTIVGDMIICLTLLFSTLGLFLIKKGIQNA